MDDFFIEIAKALSTSLLNSNESSLLNFAAEAMMVSGGAQGTGWRGESSIDKSNERGREWGAGKGAREGGARERGCSVGCSWAARALH